MKKKKKSSSDINIILPPRKKGIDYLDPMLFGISPEFRYRGLDANLVNWPAWGYGITLNYFGSTSTPNLLQSASPYVGPSDKSIEMFGTDSSVSTGGCYISPNTTLGDIGTEDFVFEFVIKPYIGGHGVLVMKGWSPSLSPYHYEIYWHSSNYPSLYMIGSAVNADGQMNSYGALSGFDHIMFVYGRTSFGLRMYRNGVMKGAPGYATGGTLSNNVALAINSTPTKQYSGIHWNINLITMWKGMNFLPASTSVLDNLVLSRYNLLNGSW